MTLAETMLAPADADAPSVVRASEPSASDLAIEVARERVGTTLRGKWYLEELLGVGGMAAVYAAVHRNGMRGAVKILHGRLTGSRTIRERFTREGWLANRVGHRGAVRVLDEDETEDGHLYLVMELLQGRSLEAVADAHEGPLPIPTVVGWIDQALATLAAAHEAGIVHRDLKPDNLFLTDDGEVKILDFGIARFRERSSSAPSITQTGEAMGTPAFMAPEQARGRWSEVDERSDVYAIGATLFTLLSGELVHGDAGTVAEMMAATFMKRARSLAAVAPNVPPAIVEVVDRALELERSARWQDAEAMRRALREATQGIRQGGWRTRRGPRALVGMAAGAALIAIAVGAGAHLRGSEEMAAELAPPALAVEAKPSIAHGERSSVTGDATMIPQSTGTSSGNGGVHGRVLAPMTDPAKRSIYDRRY